MLAATGSLIRRLRASRRRGRELGVASGMHKKWVKSNLLRNKVGTTDFWAISGFAMLPAISAVSLPSKHSRLYSGEQRETLELFVLCETLLQLFVLFWLIGCAYVVTVERLGVQRSHCVLALGISGFFPRDGGKRLSDSGDKIDHRAMPRPKSFSVTLLPPSGLSDGLDGTLVARVPYSSTHPTSDHESVGSNVDVTRGQNIVAAKPTR